MNDPLRFERRFALVGGLLTLVEAAAIGGPLYAFFTLDERQRWVLGRAGPGVLLGAWLIWAVVMRWWRAPLDRAVRARRGGFSVDVAGLQQASAASMSLPRKAALLRAIVMTLAALFLSALLVWRAALPPSALLTVASVAAQSGLTVQVFRALAWARILDRTRGALIPDSDALRLFHDLYRPRLWRAALATGALSVVATVAFAVFFLPIHLEEYRALATWFPLTILAHALVWLLVVERLTRPLERFLAAANSPDPRHRPRRDDPAARAALHAAQSLPHKLGAVKLGIAVSGQAILGSQAILLFSVEVETAMLLLGEALVVTVGATLYEVLWHRATLRPLVSHLAGRYRPLGLPGASEPHAPLGLRTKMLLSFGGLILFACGLSLFWSFLQYRTLATGFIERETEGRRDRIVAELGARLARPEAPTHREIATLLGAEARDAALIYYLPADGSEPLSFGGGRVGAPPLGGHERELMREHARGEIDAPDLHLAGTFAQLLDGQGNLVATIAVMAPGYRGRGTPIARPIRVLVFFFVLLAAVSMGIVFLVANDLTRPIRLLEQHAVAMARGDLNRPAAYAIGELDEVGRLTLAFDEMRSALDEKLRSSTEINLSLEHEVSRRTSELSRRNRELADALDALRRTQAELLRSEKMASMGRLVAGIAHEINNPVNAMVNTVGPLERALEELLARGAQPPRLGELGDDVREMTRVIRSGAQRTKEIVQALHHYSRGDETTLSQVDIHPGLDESLNLLRHQLRQGIRVERSYGEVGRVVGNEGQLQQVFMNLLTNAAQAIGERPGGGTIHLSTERDGDQVVIRVADDGPGIAEQHLARVFDPFFTTKDVGQGSGLGLSIVHGIVERHGGSISVESRAGAGTTFTVRLPAAGGARDHTDPPRRVAGAS